MTYRPIEIARFALSEFERGLEGLTDEDARKRLTKADGSGMNAISWTVCHIAGHWLNRPERLTRYAPGSRNASPPPLEDALTMLAEAKGFTESWLPDATDEFLASQPEGLGGEGIGTGVMRAALHTWFHAGEINAIRQMLGHSEISFVGPMAGELEWRERA